MRVESVAVGKGVAFVVGRSCCGRAKSVRGGGRDMRWQHPGRGFPTELRNRRGRREGRGRGQRGGMEAVVGRGGVEIGGGCSRVLKTAVVLARVNAGSAGGAGAAVGREGVEI